MLCYHGALNVPLHIRTTTTNDIVANLTYACFEERVRVNACFLPFMPRWNTVEIYLSPVRQKCTAAMFAGIQRIRIEHLGGRLILRIQEPFCSSRFLLIYFGFSWQRLTLGCTHCGNGGATDTIVWGRSDGMRAGRYAGHTNGSCGVASTVTRSTTLVADFTHMAGVLVVERPT